VHFDAPLQVDFTVPVGAGALVKPQVKRFRNWLIDESRVTQAWLGQKIQARAN
jgi:hypothetical protein